MRCRLAAAPSQLQFSVVPHAGDWKRLPMLDRLLIIRTLRPDRLTAAMSRFVSNTLGKHYVTAMPFDLERSFQVTPTLESAWSIPSTAQKGLVCNAQACWRR